MYLSKNLKTVALIDGDVIACQCAAIESGYGEDGHLDNLYATIDRRIREWVHYACADEFRVVMSKGRSFRYDIYPEYKSNRVGKAKPAGTDEAIAYLWENHDPISEDRYEADDVISILCHEEDTGEQRIACSIDKDFGQIQGWWYNPNTMRCPMYSTWEMTQRVLCEQWACGDRADGYPGIPGFGPKAFEKLVMGAHPREYWSLVQAEYLSRGLGSKTCIQMLHCAAILTEWGLPELDPPGFPETKMSPQCKTDTLEPLGDPRPS